MRIGGRKGLSVDIGSTKIRVMDIEGSGHKARLNYYDELDIPVPAEERENFIRSEGKEFLKKQPYKTFYTSTPGRGILVRTLSIPKVPLKKLHDILKYEVQQQIPFPLEMVEWKYQVLSETGQNLNILLAAAKKDLINDYLGRIHSLGIDSLYLDTDLFALLNALVFSAEFNPEKCQSILEIGASSSNLIIVFKEKILIRSLTTSGDTITNAIVESDSISFDDAEKKKIEESLQNAAVASSVENLHTEIQNSIDYWRFTQKGPEVEELFICGRGSLLKGFDRFLQEKARLKTSYFKTFSNLDLNSKYEYLRERDTEFAVVNGIALRKIHRTFVNIDITPEEIERVKEFRHNRPYIYLSAVMAALIAMTPTMFYNQDKAMLKGILNEIEISLNQYERYKPEADALRRDIGTLEGQVDTVKGLIDQKALWLRRVANIGESLPSSRIYLVSLTPGEVIADRPEEARPEEDFYEYEDYGYEDYPDMPRPEQVQPDVEITTDPGNVFTLRGEAVITDIRTAFNDFKNFVEGVKELPFIENVSIRICEVTPGEEKLEFALVLNLK